jgi:hypothetical protein
MRDRAVADMVDLIRRHGVEITAHDLLIEEASE